MPKQRAGQRRGDFHLTALYPPRKHSTDNIPSSERPPGRDNLRMSMVNPRTVLSGFTFVGNSRGPVMNYAGPMGKGYHNPGTKMHGRRY